MVFRPVPRPRLVPVVYRIGVLTHTSREVLASGACSMANDDNVTNLSDFFTKVLPRTRRELLLESFTY